MYLYFKKSHFLVLYKIFLRYVIHLYLISLQLGYKIKMNKKFFCQLNCPDLIYINMKTATISSFSFNHAIRIQNLHCSVSYFQRLFIMNRHHSDCSMLNKILYMIHLNDLKSFTLKPEVDTSLENNIVRKWAD